jgi:hypothetical protein
MCGDVEFNECSCCGKGAIVQRKYYHYNIKCDCCGGGKHFEIVRYCKDCTPKPPFRIRIVLENLTPIN